MKVFKKHFPHVDRWVRWRKKGDKGGVAKAMQRLESKIIIGGVVGDLARQMPDIPFLMIRDNLLVLPEHADVVKRLMVEQFAMMDVKPTLKAEAMAASIEWRRDGCCSPCRKTCWS